MSDALTIADGGALGDLVGSWARSLRAGNKSPRTIQSYVETARQFVGFMVEDGRSLEPEKVRRSDVEAYITSVLERHKASTAGVRYRSLQQFFRFLEDEEEIPRSPMAKMKPPAVPEEPVPVLSVEDVSKLLSTCQGKTFESLRDQAIIRLLYDTGMRKAELLGMTVENVNFDLEVAEIVGKGRRPRSAPFGPKTGMALDRYLRVRRKHPRADLPALWLGKRGALAETGLAQMLWRRGARAGVENVRPHRFRHTFAHEWLSEGGNEGDLMRLTGWKSREMLNRYGASAADERARKAHRNFSPGEKI